MNALAHQSITVLLVDDQELLRAGHRMVLEEERDLKVVGEATNGEPALRLASLLEPDVILMGVRVPDIAGVEATRRIAAAAPASKVLLLTTFDLDEDAFRALRYVTRGFLLQDASPTELANAIRTAVASNVVVPAPRRHLDTFTRRLPDLCSGPRPVATSPISALTERELEVLTEVASGLSNLEIAQKLYVAETTVETRVGHILTKLDLRDRVQAIVFAYKHGLVHPGAHVVPERTS